jgi:putative intracellular protease/amidase
MQLGKLIERLVQAREQYIFIGNPPPFNGGWHFSAVNDFEHPWEQKRLDASWQNIRIWHRVNYVPTVAEDGTPALTPAEAFDPNQKDKGALKLHEGFRLATLYFVGGLMPHTLNATVMADNAPGSLVVARHWELGATFATMGHGLDVLIACGSKERSLITGYEAAVFPRQDHLLDISGVRKADGVFCRCAGEQTGPVLVSASCCCVEALEPWFEEIGLSAGDGSATDESGRSFTCSTQEPILRLDIAALPNMTGSTFTGSPNAPNVAVLVDEVADPIEIFTIVSHVMEQGFHFQLVSHSMESEAVQRVTTETVFGNAMYGLRECMCVLTTTPASHVGSLDFDGVFIAGGQCPYFMLQDLGVTTLLDAAPVVAAVCHGPEALIGSKWLHAKDGNCAGNFISYYGAWMSFRDLLHRYEKKKPGEICCDAGGRFFSGNAPNSTKEMVTQACAAILELKKPAQS